MAYMRQGLRGLGDYEKSGDWTWEFYPPPYDFLAPANSAPQPAPIIRPPLMVTPRGVVSPARQGMSGCHCGGACGGHGCNDGGGLGFFDTPFDLSTWGLPEWGTAAGLVYVLGSILGDVKRGTRAVSKARRSRSSARSRKARLQKELASL